jgi:uncharacterized protein YecE (DUF72 family)
MDFGKLSDISKVDFSLPQEDRFYFEGKEEESIQILLGAPGWSVPKWKGVLYPRGTQSSDFGVYYSQQFATIEFNTTFYQIPKEDMIERWYQMTAPDFTFCPKMFAGISQQSHFAMGNSVLPDFLDRMTLFKEKLGMLYMQVPQSFSTKKTDALRRFIQNWRPGLPLAIELRNPTFFEYGQGESIAEDMAAAGVSWMITDVAGRRDVSHPYITAPFMGIRFVGNMDESDFGRIDAWITRLLKWQKAGVRVVYFFVHTPGDDLPHVLCDYFAKQWEKATGISLKHPKVLAV